MSTAIAEAPKHSAPNTDARQKAWRDEIHTPEAEYNANVPIDAIERDPANRTPEAHAVESLAEAIKAEGLLQPIVLRALSGGKYRIIAGEHRWRAFQHLKRKTIPARIYKNEDDLSSARKALVENLAREGLSPIERAQRFKQLADLKMSQKEIGALAGGVSQPVVANAIRLLELPPAVQKMVNDGELSEAHGVALVKWATWPRACTRMAQMARDHDYPAKHLVNNGIPFANELKGQALLEEIRTKADYWNSEPVYQLPRHFGSHRDFIVCDRATYYFVPENPKDNVWAPEKTKQDDERKKKEAAAAAREQKQHAGGKLSAEAIARKKKIASNKASRGKIKARFDAALARLKAGKGHLPGALQMVVEAALQNYKYSARLQDCAKALEIPLPKVGSSRSNERRGLEYQHLASLGADRLVRLIALCVIDQQADEAAKFAGDVPEGVELIASGKGGPK